MFETILIILNALLLFGFFVAVFAKDQNASTKVAGLIFGIVSLCNLYYIFSQIGIL